MLIESIEIIESQLNEVDKKIEESAKKLNSPIFSISDIGIYTGMCILSDNGDINALILPKISLAFLAWLLVYSVHITNMQVQSHFQQV